MNKMTIDMELRFIDNVTDEAHSASRAVEEIGKDAEQAGKKVDNLGKKKVQPTVDADTGKAMDKLNRAEKKLGKLGRSKARAVLDVLDKGSAKIAKVLGKAKDFASRTYRGLLELRDSKALSSLNNMSNKLRGFVSKTWSVAVKIKDTFTAPLTTLKNMLFNIKTMILGIAGAWAAIKFVKAPIDLADAYSSAQIGFSTLLGDSAGQQMMDSIDEFAAATPFKTSGVISNVQKMMAYGWDVERVIDDMKTIGDAAAATGRGDEGLASIVYALSEIRSKGKLSTQELNQLASAGIKAKAYLAEGLGFGTSDEGMAKLAKALEDGEVGANQAIDLILEGMKEFNGMMDKTANETVEGLMGQIEDVFEINIFRKWGQGLQDGARKGFGTVVQLLDEAESALSEFGDMMYEIGHTVSNWLADKFQKAVDKILEITDTFEFKKGTLGEKISMLWEGVVVDPLKEWWEGGGRDKTIATAGKIGEWMGQAITKGLLALFGVTDILSDEKMDELGKSGGMSIAQSFTDGFRKNFDGSAITKAFVEAISNIWNALPWWAKFLIGGYGAGKLAGGIANFAGGITSFMGGVSNVIGSFGIASSAYPILTSYGSGLLGTMGKAGVALGASTTGAALLTGAAGIGGGLAAGASVIKGGIDLYGSYKAYKEGDITESKAKATSGVSTLSGAAAGAMAGSIFGPLGTLIGAGIGGVGGWLLGKREANRIREAAADAKYLSEELENAAVAMEKGEMSAEDFAATFEKEVWQNMKGHLGDITLSINEIERLADQIVWGEDMGNFEKFTSAAQAAESAMQSLNSAGEKTDRWMWKAGLGVKFNEDEIESIKASFDEYISAAKSYVENKHYEFTAAVSLLVDVESKEGKSIIESGNAFYTKMQEQLNDLGGKLSEKVDIALEDGVITLDEQKEIENLQKQIASITEKLANAETKAELELIKLKFGKGNLDLDSFDAFMSQMQTTLNERIAANDEAFKASVSTLQLQLQEGAITEEEYNKQLQTLIDGYTGKVDSLKAEIMGVELNIIGEAYSDSEELGEDAYKKLRTALEKSLAEGIDPIDWTPDQARKFLGVDDLEDDTAMAIAKMLGGVTSQLELVEVDGKLLLDLGIETEGDTGAKAENEVKQSIPESMDEAITVNLTAFKNITNNIEVLSEEFGINKIEAETVLWELYGTKTVAAKISYLAKEFGISETEAETILWKLSGQKSVVSTFNIFASDFGIRQSYTFRPTINVDPVKGNVASPVWAKTLYEGQYRGGIVGGSSALEAFARGGIAGYSDGGMVQGGAKLIKVAEEGNPEMIIPLGSQRRERALKLWAKAGEMLGVNKFARGGVTDGSADVGARASYYGSDGGSGGQTVQVDVGGITVEIHVSANGHENIVDAIKAQIGEITDAVAGALAEEIGALFANTPVRGEA